MAVATDTGGQALTRSTNIVAGATAFTCLFWVKPIDNPSGSRRLWTTIDDINTYTDYIAIASTGADENEIGLEITENGVVLQTSAVTPIQVDGWSHVAYTRSGTTHTIYVNGASGASVTQNVSTLTLAANYLVGDSYPASNVDSNLQYYREWNVALTLAQIIAEANSTTPIVTSGLVANTPLVTNYEDTTAGNNDWTPIDSPTFIQGPVPYAATNTSGAAAHDLADILDGPGALQVMKTSGGTSNTFFWTYTPTVVSGFEYISFFGFGATSVYIPSSRIYLDAAATVLLRSDVSRPVYAPLEAATPYWYRIAPNGNPARGSLWIRAEKFVNAASPPGGSILINDASDGWPVAILDGTTAEPIAYRHPFPSGEAMASLNDGTVIVLDQGASPSNLQIWDSSLTLQHTLGLFSNYLSSDQATTFYAETATNTVTAISSAGVTTGSFNLGANPVAFAPARSGGILYYALSGTNVAIKRWNTLTNLAMSDLVAGVASNRVKEIFVLQDGTVLVLYQINGSPFTCFVRQYSAAGATLATFTTQFADNTGTDPHLAINYGDTSTSFIAWYKTATDTSRFLEIQTSDGTILKSVEVPWFQLGENGQPLGPDMAFWGHSESCTFLITQTPTPEPPVPGEDYHFETTTPRRLRRCPFVWKNAKWLFVSQIQVLFESGVGLSSGQGEHPVIMCRWSKDGGHTWSNLHDMSLGDMGHYAFRTMLRRLGRGRDWLFEITATDPVKLNGMGLLLDVEEGTS